MGAGLKHAAYTVAITTALAACSSVESTPQDTEQDYSIDFSDGFQQSDADAILHECNATDVTLEVTTSGEIVFQPDPNSDYDSSVCVLEHIKASGTTKFGFVGNERYVTPEEGQ